MTLGAVGFGGQDLVAVDHHRDPLLHEEGRHDHGGRGLRSGEFGHGSAPVLVGQGLPSWPMGTADGPLVTAPLTHTPPGEPRPGNGRRGTAPVVQRGVTSTHARTERRGEARLPAAIAVLAAIALYALLPDNLLLGPRLVIPALGVLLLVALVVVNPRRLTRQTRFSRIASLVLVGLIGLANTVALVMLLRALLASHVRTAGRCSSPRCRCG